jgi:hypothetical protein
VDDKTKKTIYACIVYLKNHGYEVREREGNKVGKWVTYKKDGMNCVLHGKIIYDYVSCYCVKRKNACTDIIGLDNIIDFFNSKEECYSIQ